jgi:xanthine dehydrogenase molybdopterin-binding subunit B
MVTTFEARRKSYLAPRTVAVNVQGIRLAVHRVTAEIRILHSVHAADIGRLINPMQCRGQIDGSIGMGIGWALTAHMVHNEKGMIDRHIANWAATPGQRLRPLPMAPDLIDRIPSGSAPNYIHNSLLCRRKVEED